MPTEPKSRDDVSETGNWNVADQYTKSKIMRPLNLCDLYEDIAQFGYESIMDELGNYSAPPNDVVRIKALNRLIRELLRLINNAKFALKKKGTREKILEYKEHLKKLRESLPNLVEIERNNIEGSSNIKIKDEILFQKFLEAISEIKSKINEPLNQNHLIFTDKEEFDPKKFKEQLKDRMINKG